jgi:hypothetical protein
MCPRTDDLEWLIVEDALLRDPSEPVRDRERLEWSVTATNVRPRDLEASIMSSERQAPRGVHLEVGVRGR